MDGRGDWSLLRACGWPRSQAYYSRKLNATGGSDLQDLPWDSPENNRRWPLRDDASTESSHSGKRQRRRPGSMPKLLPGQDIEGQDTVQMRIYVRWGARSPYHPHARELVRERTADERSTANTARPTGRRIWARRSSATRWKRRRGSATWFTTSGATRGSRPGRGDPGARPSLCPARAGSSADADDLRHARGCPQVTAVPAGTRATWRTGDVSPKRARPFRRINDLDEYPRGPAEDICSATRDPGQPGKSTDSPSTIIVLLAPTLLARRDPGRNSRLPRRIVWREVSPCPKMSGGGDHVHGRLRGIYESGHRQDRTSGSSAR